MIENRFNHISGLAVCHSRLIILWSANIKHFNTVQKKPCFQITQHHSETPGPFPKTCETFLIKIVELFMM